MKTMSSTALVVLLLLGVAAPSAGQAPILAGKYRTWLNRDVTAIIAPEERDAFLKLTGDRDRDLFIEEFWRQRDPTPGTPRNEFREEHLRRLVYADERFGAGGSVPGRKTDRGRILIKLGPPLDVLRFRHVDIYPVEVWYYLRELRSGGLAFFRLLFFWEYGADEYRLYNPVSDGPKRLFLFPERLAGEGGAGSSTRAADDRTLPEGWTVADRQAYRILGEAVAGELAEATLSAYPGLRDPGQAAVASALLDEIESAPLKIVDLGYLSDFPAGPTGREVNYSLHPMKNASTAWVLQDASGRWLVNMAVVPEVVGLGFFQDRYFAGLRIRVRVRDETGAPVLEKERFAAVDPVPNELKTLAAADLELQDAYPLPPGRYRLEWKLENTVSKEFSSVDQTLAVPAGGTPWLSPLLLCRNAVPDAPGEGGAFRVGAGRIYPSLEGTFQPGDTLAVFVQALGLDPAWIEQGRLEFAISSGGTLVRTARRSFTDSANGRDFLEKFPLADFAPGAYAVKAAVLDRDGKEILTETAAFTVAARPPRGVWAVDASIY
jgi:GWxTD domain-containing protein